MRRRKHCKRVQPWHELPFPRLGDEPWQREAVQWLADKTHGLPSPLFSTLRLNRFALDYVRQAPVILTIGAHQVVTEIEAGGRLRDLLARLGLAQPLRRICPAAALVGDAPMFRALSRLHPSALAQAIPVGAAEQHAWVVSLVDWRGAMEGRGRDIDFRFEWAAINGARALALRIKLRDLADTAAALGDRFVPSWTVERAQAASEAWHAELASTEGAARIYREFGYGIDDPIDYGDLPLRMDVGGFTFVALRSGADLHEDGHRMRHCVASYSGHVLHGKCRIYSIRKGETPLATLELVLTRKTWTLGQVKGPCNQPPDDPVLLAADTFFDFISKPGEAAS